MVTHCKKCHIELKNNTNCKECFQQSEEIRIMQEKEYEIIRLYKGKRNIKNDEVNEIKKIINIDEDNCVESYPCQHYVLFELNNGDVVQACLSSVCILDLSKKYDYTFERLSHFNEHGHFNNDDSIFD